MLAPVSHLSNHRKSKSHRKQQNRSSIVSSLCFQCGMVTGESDDDFCISQGGSSSSKKGSNLKGMSKKSIFASPETLTGRVSMILEF